MTITVDVATESIRTDTSSPYTYTHTGAASSGIKGVLVCIMHGTSNTDHVSAVSYGGTALTRVVRASCSTAEPGAAEVWFLGASVPQGGGDKTVSVTCGSTTDDIHVVTVTLLGSYDLEVVSTGTAPVTVGSNPSVALTSWSRSGMAFAAGYSGVTAQTSVSAGTNCSKVGTGELTGNFCSYVIRQTTAATGDFTIAATIASDDRAFAAAMVTEASPIAPTTGSLTLTGEAALTWRVRIEPPSGRIWLTTAGQFEPAAGSVALTGYAPTVTVTGGGNTTITPTVGSLGLTGQSGAVNRSVLGTAGSLTLPGTAPSLAYTLTVPIGSLALTGYGSTVSRYTLGTVGTLTLTGAAPTVTVSTNIAITPTTGGLTLTGQIGTVNQTIAGTAGALVLTGYAPTVTVSASGTITPTAGSLTLTGYAPAVSANITITPAAGFVMLTTYGLSPQVQPAAGSLTLTGYAPAVTVPISISPTAGTLTLTGYAPTVQVGASVTIAPATGSLTFTGYISPQTYTLPSPATASLTLTGYAPTVQVGSSRTITPTTGSLALTGYGATVARYVLGTAGTVTLTGYAPTVTVTTGLTITPNSGSLGFSGDQSTLANVVAGTDGSISLQGFAPSVTVGLVITPTAAALTIQGAGSTVNQQILTTSGDVAFTGFVPNLVQSNVTIIPDSGLLTIAGYAAQISVPSSRPPGGSGHPVYWQGKRRKARLAERPNLHLRAILDDVVRELYGELTEDDVPAEVQKQAAKLVKPYAEKKAKKLAVPPESAVDWDALEKDAARVKRIIALWREQETRREIDDDDEFMLLID